MNGHVVAHRDDLSGGIEYGAGIVAALLNIGRKGSPPQRGAHFFGNRMIEILKYFEFDWAGHRWERVYASNATSCELRASCFEQPHRSQLDARGTQPSPRCYTSLTMAEGRSRVWLWLLFGGGAFLLFVVAVFTLVYLSFGNRD